MTTNSETPQQLQLCCTSCVPKFAIVSLVLLLCCGFCLAFLFLNLLLYLFNLFIYFWFGCFAHNFINSFKIRVQEVNSVFLCFLMYLQMYIPALIIISCVKANFVIFAMVGILAGASLASIYLLPW